MVFIVLINMGCGLHKSNVCPRHTETVIVNKNKSYIRAIYRRKTLEGYGMKAIEEVPSEFEISEIETGKE